MKGFSILLFVRLATLLIAASGVIGSSLDKPSKSIVLGLISRCTHHPQIPANTVGETASVNLLMFSKFILRDLVYKEIDTCSERDLSKALISIFNEKEYANQNATKVKHILTYIPEEMLKTLLSVVSFSKHIIVWPLQTVQDQVWFRNHPNFENFHQRVVKKPADVVVEMMETFSWHNVHVVDVLVDSQEDIVNKQQLDFRKLFQNVNKGRCISYSNFTVSEIRTNAPKLLNEFEQLRQELNTPVVFLNGNKGDLYKDMALANGVNKYWILFTDKSKISDAKTNHRASNEFISILNSGEVLYFHLLPFSDNNCSGAESEKCPDLETRTAIVKKNIPIRCLNIAQWEKDGTYKKLEYIQHLTDGRNLKIQSMDSISRTTSSFKSTKILSKCPDCLYCNTLCPGNETFAYVNPGALYKKKGLTCNACPDDYIITRFGECQPCPPEMRLSANRHNVCYDPVIRFEVSPACYVLTAIGLAVTLLTIIVYSMYRKTPVVKSSNFELSMIQLSSCILMHVFSIVFNSALELTDMVCTIRPIVYSTLTVAVAAIVVCKAEKILIIFFTKQRLTKKNIKDIGIRQIVIFGFLISVNFILVPASFTIPASVKLMPTEEVIKGDAYYYKYCSSDAEFYIQAIYAVAILVLAIFQGYRGRKLPTNYNEGNSILLSSVMTISALIFCMWTLKTSQHSNNPYLILNSMWGSLTVALIFLVVCLYGVKVFVILFQANKNTKTYQVNIMLADALKRTEKKMLNPLYNISNRKRAGSLLKLVENNVSDKLRKSTQSLTRFRTLSIDDL